ncbi:type II toxin-antitoxin system RelE/ParE family toxin [Thiomicrospira sp.]|uniref:type II toxin-antitoxin system RelE/ParE family toxin n=1 Tax=Thiomicrospira sp. TaxID=935 RepID=UPI002F950858
MKIIYTKQAQTQLKAIKAFVAKDNLSAATTHLLQIKSKIELLADFPFIGQINPILNKQAVRDWVILGYKVIYKVSENQLVILAIYKNIDFDESALSENS